MPPGLLFISPTAAGPGVPLLSHAQFPVSPEGTEHAGVSWERCPAPTVAASRGVPGHNAQHYISHREILGLSLAGVQGTLQSKACSVLCTLHAEQGHSRAGGVRELLLGPEEPVVPALRLCLEQPSPCPAQPQTDPCMRFFREAPPVLFPGFLGDRWRVCLLCSVTNDLIHTTASPTASVESLPKL